MSSEDETQDSSSVGGLGSQEVILACPSIETSTMTEAEVLRMCEKYHLLSAFHVHAPRQKDRVNSYPADRMAVYEEFFRAGLRFHFHPFLVNILDFYRVVLT